MSSPKTPMNQSSPDMGCSSSLPELSTSPQVSLNLETIAPGIPAMTTPVSLHDLLSSHLTPAHPRPMFAPSDTPKRARNVRDAHFRKRLPFVQAAARRMQSALEIYDPKVWPIPVIPPGSDGLVEANVTKITEALNACQDYAVEMGRMSSMHEYVDENIEQIDKQTEKACEAELNARKVQEEKVGRDKHVAEADAAVEVEPGNSSDCSTSGSSWGEKGDTSSHVSSLGTSLLPGEAIDNKAQCGPAILLSSSGQKLVEIGTLAGCKIAASPTSNSAQQTSHTSEIDTATVGKAPTSSSSGGNGARKVDNKLGQEKPAKGKDLEKQRTYKQAVLGTPVHNLKVMLGGFTNAICHQRILEVSPILSLTLKDTTPLIVHPPKKRCILLQHFEVGLDGVEAICQGKVQVPESDGWKKFVREGRLGPIGTIKVGNGGFSEELKQMQEARGYGVGWWVFYGIRFKQTGKEKRKGQGGKWVCFGSPLEACSQMPGKPQMAVVGGGKDRYGNEVERDLTELLRSSTLFSKGGIACMDLWEGGLKWEGGLWAEVRDAMANNGLVVSFLFQDLLSQKQPPMPNLGTGNLKDEEGQATDRSEAMGAALQTGLAGAKDEGKAETGAKGLTRNQQRRAAKAAKAAKDKTSGDPAEK